MNATPLVYTRTLRSEYRLLVQPGLARSEPSVLDYFIQFARAVIDEETLAYGSVAHPRWALCSHHGFLLWGAGFRNSQAGLPGGMATDERGEIIRTFAGLIVPDRGLPPDFALPFGLPFLRDLFERYVAPEWEAAPGRPVPEATELALDRVARQSVITAGSFDGERMSTSPTQIQVFPHDAATEQKLLAAALACVPREMRAVTGLNSPEHARAAAFWNATALECSEALILEGIVPPPATRPSRPKPAAESDEDEQGPATVRPRGQPAQPPTGEPPHEGFGHWLWRKLGRKEHRHEEPESGDPTATQAPRANRRNAYTTAPARREKLHVTGPRRAGETASQEARTPVPSEIATRLAALNRALAQRPLREEEVSAIAGLLDSAVQMAREGLPSEKV